MVVFGCQGSQDFMDNLFVFYDFITCMHSIHDYLDSVDLSFNGFLFPMLNSSYCRRSDWSFIFFIFSAVSYPSCRISHVYLVVVALDTLWNTVGEIHLCRIIRVLQSIFLFSLYIFLASSESFFEPFLNNFINFMRV